MAASSRSRPVRALLVCSGLEHAHRGFESFARECFDVLFDEPTLEMHLIKGSGPVRDRERPVPALHRDAKMARGLGRLWGGPIHVEQLAFALSLQREILRTRPDVIYFSEWYTGVGLAHLRRLNRQRYALVLSNGSMASGDFGWCDRVHQHTAPALDYVLSRGADPARHILLPVAFKMLPDYEPPDDQERRSLREKLELPFDRPVVTSVAALNSWHKRLDYVIREVAQMPEPRPFLLLVGQPEAETEQIKQLAKGLLGTAGHSIRTVPRREIDQLLRASDRFVLASLAEGLPRALIEAMGHGLPCLAHDYDVARYALGEHGRFADFRRPGSLAALLRESLTERDSAAAARARHAAVYKRFSWDTLRPKYVEMLRGAVGGAPFPADA